MNQSEQIREQLNTLSELEHLLPTLLLEVDKQLVLEVQEQLKALTDTTERILQMLEIGFDLLQKARSSLEGDPSSQGNRLDGEDHQDKFVSSSPQDEPYRDTPAAGISQASMDIYYIKYSDHNSEEGYYQNNPDEDTRFQITVSQASPHVGILRIYDEIDDGDKKELMQQKLKLINKVGGLLSGFSIPRSIEEGRVSLDPDCKSWKLETPITINL